MSCIRIFSAALVMFLLASCTLPKTGGVLPKDAANFSLKVSGDYETVADCSFLKIRDAYFGELKKIDLPSMHLTQLSFGNDTYKVWEINFRQGNGSTFVDAHVPPAIWGEEYWPERLTPLIKQCAA